MKKRKRRISLRIAIIIGIVEVLSMVVMMFVGNYGMAGLLREEAFDNLGVIAKDRAALVETYIEGCCDFVEEYSLSSEIRNVLKDPDDPEKLKAAREFTLKSAEGHESIEGLYTAEWDTFVLAHINPESMDQTFREPDAAKALEDQIREKGDAFCTGIVLAPVTKKMVIPVYAPVFDEKGEAIGFAGAAFYTDGLERRLNALTEDSEKTGYSLLNADNSVYIFDDDASHVGTECKEPEKVDAVRYFANEGKDSSVWTYTGDGRVEVFYRIPDRNWIFVVEDSESAVFAVIDIIRNRLTIAGTVVTIAMVVICFILIELTMKPLRAINNQIERLKRSDYSKNEQVMKYCSREDEFGTIANAVVELHGVMENQYQLFLEMLEAQTAGTLVTDAADKTVVLINGTALKLYGIDPNKKSTVTLDEIRARFDVEDLSRIEEARDKAMNTGEEITFEAAVTHDDGTRVQLFNLAKAARLSNGDTVVIFSIIDITDRKHLEENLLVLSETDSMTGLCNRRSGESRVERALQEGQHGLFCLLDANKFKYVNDTFGHATGDLVLIALAETMRNTFRKTDILIRLGGDEFAFFLAEVEDVSLCERLIDKFMAAIDTIEIPELKGHKITVSLGAVIVKEEMSFSKICNRADELMYRCKQKGGMQYEKEWDPS